MLVEGNIVYMMVEGGGLKFLDTNHSISMICNDVPNKFGLN